MGRQRRLERALLIEHREFVARHAADLGGQIIKTAGDGYWLEFPSVTAAAKSAIAMQEALRLAQTGKGDNRLLMRVVIGLGDVAVQEGDLIGEALALVVRIEAITPADEIYLTSAARLALKAADVQTALVDSFALKGFAEPIAVYHVQQRHRTRVIADALILYSDLRGFRRLTEVLPVHEAERLFDTLDALANGAAHEFGGTVLFSRGDSYCLTFNEPLQVIAAAERLSRDWEAARREEWSGINIALHRGRINVYRSFLYGEGIMIAGRVLEASLKVLAAGEGAVFVTSPVRDNLSSSLWHNRLQPVALKLQDALFWTRGLSPHRQPVLTGDRVELFAVLTFARSALPEPIEAASESGYHHGHARPFPRPRRKTASTGHPTFTG